MSFSRMTWPDCPEFYELRDLLGTIHSGLKIVGELGLAGRRNVHLVKILIPEIQEACQDARLSTLTLLEENWANQRGRPPEWVKEADRIAASLVTLEKETGKVLSFFMDRNRIYTARAQCAMCLDGAAFLLKAFQRIPAPGQVKTDSLEEVPEVWHKTIKNLDMGGI